jgi:hypothetical protein
LPKAPLHLPARREALIANDLNTNMTHMLRDPAEVVGSSSDAIEPSNPKRSPLPAWLMAIWLIGFLYYLVRIGLAQWSLFRIVKDANPAKPAVQSTLQTACEKLGVSQVDSGGSEAGQKVECQNRSVVGIGRRFTKAKT